METKQNVDELARLSGENMMKQFRYVVPILKFNGSKNTFSYLETGSDGKINSKNIVSKTLDLVILKVRRTFTSFQQTSTGNISWFTNEHNSWRDSLTLFERKDNARPKMIDFGSIEDLRAKYPDLRLKQNLYVLYKDSVVKIGVKGKSLSSLFEYYKEFKELNDHMFAHNTVVSSHMETNTGGLNYYVMDFKKGKEVDLSVVGEKIREVANALEQQDKSYKTEPTEEEIIIDRNAPIPIIDEEIEEEQPAGSEEEINVKDIPL